MSRTRNPWGDGRDVHVLDELCELRPCLQVGEDKGNYTPGRGYTSYRKNPPLVCMRRHCHGCPHPLPEPDPERARCCPAPSFPPARPGKKPSWQACRTCGARAHGGLLELARALPSHPASRCKHTAAEPRDLGTGLAWRCSCGSYFERKPKPHELGLELKAFLEARSRAQEEAHALLAPARDPARRVGQDRGAGTPDPGAPRSADPGPAD